MCFETSQLAYRIYQEAQRMGASKEEIEKLRKQWEKLKDGGIEFHHVSGFSHPELVIFKDKEGERIIERNIWGLIPPWIKDVGEAQDIWDKTLNARGETIFEKPSFKNAAKTGRCVIPLDGFFEHHHKRGTTFPYFIRQKDNQRLLVGGLSEEWVNQGTGAIVHSCAIVTTPGNELMTEIHNNPKLAGPRMPLILNEESAEAWLLDDNEAKVLAIQPNQTVELENYTVRRLRGKSYVGNVEEVTEPYEHAEMIDPPELF